MTVESVLFRGSPGCGFKWASPVYGPVECVKHFEGRHWFVSSAGTQRGSGLSFVRIGQEDKVRDAYSRGDERVSEEFDRALAEYTRQVAERAWDEAFEAAKESVWSLESEYAPVNPYRGTPGQEGKRNE